MSHQIKPFEKQFNHPIDRNDPDAAASAVELQLPESFSVRAQKVFRYFDDTLFLFLYKGKLVATDESLYLTEHGDGSHDAPFGAPRWVGDTLEDFEIWLEDIADWLDAEDDPPGWEEEAGDDA